MDIKGLIKELKEIEKDCLELKKRNDLTEWGQGELFIIKLVKKYLNWFKEELKN